MRLRATLPALIAMGLLSACVGPSPRADRAGPSMPAIAQPGDIVAVESAMGLMAQDEGSWPALLAYAAPDAVIAFPGVAPTPALPWLEGREVTAPSAKWQVHDVWMSCDGSFAFSRGGWRGTQAFGRFQTAWWRDETGQYRWIYDDVITLSSPLPDPDMVATHVARCGPVPVDAGLSDAGAPVVDTRSKDGTLRLVVHRGEGADRTVSLTLWDGSAMTDVPLTDPAGSD